MINIGIYKIIKRKIMNKMKKYFPTLLILILGILFLFSCNSAKKINPYQYKNPKITFGSGGGFTGVESSYTLLDNGQLFQLTKMGQEFNRLNKIDKNKVTQIFETCKLFKLEEIKLNNPGNMYHYLDISIEGKQNRIVWGNGSVDEKIKVLHQILMSFVK